MRDADIAFEFGVSRMPVREALRRLEDEGLVQAAASRWTRVSPLDIEEARRLHSIVSALEALAVRLIGSLDEVLTDRSRWQTKALRVSLAKGDPLEAWRADEAFHEVLVDAAHKSLVVRDHRSLQGPAPAIRSRFLQGARGGDLLAR